MVTIILQELLWAIGRFFMNPLVYVAFLVAIFVGYVRVKRERKFFHIRILNGWSEFKSLLRIGIVAPIVLSIITIGAGLTLPTSFLMIVSAVSIILLLLFNFHLLSAAITFGVAFIVSVLLFQQGITIEFLNWTVTGFEYTTVAATSIAIIIGLLLMMEGYLIAKDGSKFASPIIEKTNRGLKSIAYTSKKHWVIPTLFLIPGDVLEQFAPYWPALPIGETQFSLILFPVVIGFQQVTRRLLPSSFYAKLGRNVGILGFIVILGGVASYFEQLVALITLAVAIVGRFALSFGYKLTEKKDLYAVAPNNRGVVIAAVLPNSPAEKMGLRIGEIIKRVNGRDVGNERELYEALQINAAHCKLEVLDYDYELRLTQYVVHNHDHHQIGLIIVQ